MKCLKIFILLFFLANITSCATSNVRTFDPVQNLLKTAKRSFVKIEVSVWNLSCVESDNNKIECTKDKIGGAWGSGSIINYKGKKHILTVAHICESERLNAMAKLTNQKLSYDFAATIEANDWHSYGAVPIKIDHKNDICIMAAANINAPFIKMANTKPTYGEKVYTVASPGGLAQNGMVPNFEGRFLGINDGRAYYSVPAMGGSSGSPLINSRGELVGVTHSVYAYFHHVSVSSTFEELWNFVSN